MSLVAEHISIQLKNNSDEITSQAVQENTSSNLNMFRENFQLRIMDTIKHCCNKEQQPTGVHEVPIERSSSVKYPRDSPPLLRSSPTRSLNKISNAKAKRLSARKLQLKMLLRAKSGNGEGSSQLPQTISANSSEEKSPRNEESSSEVSGDDSSADESSDNEDSRPEGLRTKVTRSVKPSKYKFLNDIRLRSGQIKSPTELLQMNMRINVFQKYLNSTEMISDHSRADYKRNINILNRIKLKAKRQGLLR